MARFRTAKDSSLAKGDSPMHDGCRPNAPAAPAGALAARHLQPVFENTGYVLTAPSGAGLIGDDDGGAARETRIFRETMTVGGATNPQPDLLVNSPNGRMRIARHEVAAQCRETGGALITKVPAGRLALRGTTMARKRGTGHRAKATVLKASSRGAAAPDAAWVWTNWWAVQRTKWRTHQWPHANIAGAARKMPNKNSSFLT